MEKTSWLDEPRNVKRLWRAFILILAVTVAAELFVTLQPHFTLESIFAFHAWFGFAACVAMIVVAKGLSLLLKRPDTYYDERDD